MADSPVVSSEKQKRRLQRRISCSYEKNKKGESYCKTNNVIKKEKLLLKRNHRLTNIRKNYLNQTISEIINRKPRFICIEDLNVSGMMKNRLNPTSHDTMRKNRCAAELLVSILRVDVQIERKFDSFVKFCSCRFFQELNSFVDIIELMTVNDGCGCFLFLCRSGSASSRARASSRRERGRVTLRSSISCF